MSLSNDSYKVVLTIFISLKICNMCPDRIFLAGIGCKIVIFRKIREKSSQKRLFFILLCLRYEYTLCVYIMSKDIEH